MNVEREEKITSEVFLIKIINMFYSDVQDVISYS